MLTKERAEAQAIYEKRYMLLTEAAKSERDAAFEILEESATWRGFSDQRKKAMEMLFRAESFERLAGALAA